MKDLDNIRIAGVIVDMLDSFGFRKEDIYEISELVKKQAELKENYEPAAAVAAEEFKPCAN